MRLARPAVIAGAAAALALLVAIGTALPARRVSELATSCPGKERWAIKTLTDPTASSVGFAHPVATTVAALAAQAPGVQIKSSTPRLASEKKVYRVTASLEKAKIEFSPSSGKGDEDIHLVIADPTTGQTMIAEFPKLPCAPASSSSKALRMAQARAAFITACGTPPTGSPVTLQGSARISGVGFFDLHHSTPQLGRAPHDRELHPVLSFKLLTPCH